MRGEQSGLLCVISGMPHSGTTILSKLLTAHPRVNAAFECGILMAQSPAGIPNLKPWGDWLVAPIEEDRWGLTPEQLREVAAAPDWHGAYLNIVEHCPLFREGETLIVDKCPGYMAYLETVMAKVPGFPCLVLQKDVLLLFHSYKRRGFGVERFTENFNRCLTGLIKAEAKFPVTLISQERIAEDRVGVFRELCGLLGLEYEERFMSRDWCKLNMSRSGFRWLFRRPYVYQELLAKAREEVTPEEIAVMKDRLLRPESWNSMFTALDAVS